MSLFTTNYTGDEYRTRCCATRVEWFGSATLEQIRALPDGARIRLHHLGGQTSDHVFHGIDPSNPDKFLGTWVNGEAEQSRFLSDYGLLPYKTDNGDRWNPTNWIEILES